MKLRLTTLFSGPPRLRTLHLVVWLLSFLLFTIACLTPALRFEAQSRNEPTIYNGFEVLLMGWMGIFLGFLGWYANLPFFLGLFFFFFRRWLLTLSCLLLALALALTSPDIVGKGIPLDEAMVNMAGPGSLQIGYVFWLASMVVILLGDPVLWWYSRRLRKAAVVQGPPAAGDTTPKEIL